MPCLHHMQLKHARFASLGAKIEMPIICDVAKINFFLSCNIPKSSMLMRTVVLSVLQFSLIKPCSPLAFQIKIRKPLLRVQEAKRIRRATAACAFLFETLRLFRGLPVQIMGF